eukprot:TRINITY_DN57163_c0_g1_i1.p1 TRINITY_DN57163_c0_g1~~TRINITY_DN57163_c0_g1_i1.p1  ORF type:complete len:311 (-),score=86.59 TRINITY_DN57163_c0_g1_i1:149-1081(-)
MCIRDRKEGMQTPGRLGHMDPVAMDKLRQQLITAQSAASEAKRTTELNRIRHANQISLLSEKVEIAKTVSDNLPQAALPKKSSGRVPLGELNTSSRALLGEKRALDQQIRDQQGTDRRLSNERDKLLAQFSNLEEVWAPVGDFQYAACEMVSVDAQRIVLIRKDTKECLERQLDELLPEDPGATDPPPDLLSLERLQPASLMEAIRHKVASRCLASRCGPNLIAVCRGGPGLDLQHLEEENQMEALKKQVSMVRDFALEDKAQRTFVFTGNSGSGKSMAARAAIEWMLSAEPEMYHQPCLLYTSPSPRDS